MKNFFKPITNRRFLLFSGNHLPTFWQRLLLIALFVLMIWDSIIAAATLGLFFSITSNNSLGEVIKNSVAVKGPKYIWAEMISLVALPILYLWVVIIGCLDIYCDPYRAFIQIPVILLYFPDLNLIVDAVEIHKLNLKEWRKKA